MLLEGLSRTTFQELEQTLERHISERTWGRIHCLQVSVTDERVSVQGFTASYYVKQLAIQAILEVLGPSHDWRVDADIEVGNCETRNGVAPLLARRR